MQLEADHGKLQRGIFEVLALLQLINLTGTKSFPPALSAGRDSTPLFEARRARSFFANLYEAQGKADLKS